VVRAGRVVLLLLLLRWTFTFIVWPMREDVIGATFLHAINLPFHEAGHIIFSPFGEFMTTLGGSLAQVLIPIVCGVAFLTSSWNPFGAAVMFWWAGENLMDVAIYINDARSLELTLIGGHTGAEVDGHDWERLLTMTNSLHLDHRLGNIAHFTGAAIMIGSLAVATVIAIKAREEESWLSGKL
jgi:hypothetical protein